MTQAHREFILEHAPELLDDFVDLVQLVAPDGTFLYVNGAWTRKLGYSAEDALGLTFLDVIHPDHQAAWKSIFRAVLDGQRLDNFAMVLVSRAGVSVPVDGSVWAFVVDGKPAAVCSTLRDSAARAVGEQQVSRLLYRDELTGLLSRRGFAVRAMPLLEVVEENRERLGAWLLFLDIDNLDQTQRRYGEEAVNQAVLRTTGLLRQGLRAHDVVARMSTSSFVALVSLPPRYQASYVTARLRGALQLANRQAATPWGVELAVGMVKVEIGTSLDQAIERAAAEARPAAARVTLHT